MRVPSDTYKLFRVPADPFRFPLPQRHVDLFGTKFVIQHLVSIQKGLLVLLDRGAQRENDLLIGVHDADRNGPLLLSNCFRVSVCGTFVGEETVDPEPATVASCGIPKPIRSHVSKDLVPHGTTHGDGAVRVGP